MDHLRPETLKAFFQGRISSNGLGRQVTKAVFEDRPVGPDAVRNDLDEDFIVTRDHLVLLCDAGLDGDLEPPHLQAIGSVLVSSERFLWNLGNIPTDLINEVIYAWDTPDLNYNLTMDTVSKFRTLLRTGENNFDEGDRKSDS